MKEIQKEKQTMKTNQLLISLVIYAALLLAGCTPGARVGELRTESQSVELANAESVRVEIKFGAGDLNVTNGAGKLLEADFTYNVAELKPEVKYIHGRLILSQPDSKGLSDLRGISGFRNEWGLRLNDQVPMDLNVEMGAGNSDLQLAGLALTGLDITLGAGGSTIDLSGDWAHDLNVTIHAGAGEITVRLPQDVGARVKVDAGVGTIEAPDLINDGNVYTNNAYAESDVTMQVDIDAGVGQINLEVEE
jgi:hypothetical protein